MKMKTRLASITLLTAIFAGAATAGNVTIPNTFTSNTKAVAAEVNENFTAVKTAVDDNQTQIDALAVTGNAVGDMQYWDGAAWVLINAPTGPDIATLRFCDGQPKWEGCSYAIGDIGPAGGIVFYISNGGVNGLEAALTDLSAPTSYEWGCRTTATGAVATDIGSGAANTDTIVASNCTPETPGNPIAANAAAAFSFGGKTDWFLPSKDELSELYLQRGMVGIASGLYWSSSEDGTGNAWDLDFATGIPSSDGKQNTLKVRAIRAF